MTNQTAPTAAGDVSFGHNRPTIPLLSKMELLEDHGAFVSRKAELIARAAAIPEDVTGWCAEHDEACIALGRDITKFLTEVEDTRKRINEPYIGVTTAINDLFNKDWRDGVAATKTKVASLGGKRVDHKAALEAQRLEDEARLRREQEQARLDAAAEAEAAGQHTKAGIMLEQAQVAADRAQQTETRADLASHQDLGRTRSAAGTMTARRSLGVTIDRATLDLEALRAFLPLDALEKAVRQHAAVNGNKIAPNGRDLLTPAPLKGVTYEAVSTGSFR